MYSDIIVCAYAKCRELTELCKSLGAMTILTRVHLSIYLPVYTFQIHVQTLCITNVINKYKN